MTNKALTESVVEEAALALLEGLGYVVLSGPAGAPGEPGAVREQYGQVVLGGQLGEDLQRLNPEVPEEALEDAFRKLTRPDSPSLVGNNQAIHKYLVEGCRSSCSAGRPSAGVTEPEPVLRPGPKPIRKSPRH